MAVNVAQPPPAPEINRQMQLLPTLDPGVSITTRDGFPIPVSLTTSSAQGEVMVAGDGWTMSVALGDEDSVGETGDGAVIRFTRDKTASVTGSGFMAGTRADIWLFSEPTFLGEFTVAADGTFVGRVPLNGIAAGLHTLQVNGTSFDGVMRSANLGVIVTERPAPGDAVLPSTGANGSMASAWALVMLAIGGLLVIVRRGRRQDLTTV
jgi:LPXTG-motif cell wall-anchored protein